MPHRFERLRTATEPMDICDTMSWLEENYCRELIYIGARCYGRSIGPPQPFGKMTRWFQPGVNPDQLCLPFASYNPLRVMSAYANFHPILGEGWVVCYENALGRQRDLQYNVNQTQSANRILALSIYEKIEVLREPENPFVANNRDWPASPTLSEMQSNTPSTSPRLIELLQRPHVRQAVETEVREYMPPPHGPVQLATTSCTVRDMHGACRAEVMEYRVTEHDIYQICIHIFGCIERRVIQVRAN